MSLYRILAISLLCWFQSSYAVQLSDIRIYGAARFTRETLLNYASVDVGDDLKDYELSQIISNLYATGFFEEVSAELLETDTLVIKVKERPVIAKVTVNGSKHFSQEDINKSLDEYGLLKGRTYNERSLDQMIRELKFHYSIDGYYDPTITYQVNKLSAGTVQLDFEINDGPVARIVEINFHGNAAFPSHVLRNQILLRTSNLFTFIMNADKYSQYRVDQDISLLVDFYKKNGYPFMSVKDAHPTLTPGKKGIVLDFFIEENDRCFVEGIEIEGLPYSLQEMEITVPALPFLYNQQQLQDIEQLIKDAIAQRGYPYYVLNQNNQKIGENALKVKFVLEKGEMFWINSYNFKGNTRTKTSVLRNMIKKPEGVLYSQTDLNDTKKSMEKSGLFNTVSISSRKIFNNKVDIDIQLEEANTKTFYMQAGFSTIGSSWSLGIDDKNILGTGATLRTSFNYDHYDKAYKLGIVHPYLTTKNIEISYNLEHVDRDYQNQFMAYKQSKNFTSNALGATWLLSGHTRFGITATHLVEKNLNVVEDDEKKLSHYVFIGASLNRNLFNRFILSDQGYNWGLNASLSTPLSDYTYGDLSCIGQKFTPLGQGFIFYQQASGRYQFTYGSGDKSFIPSARMLNCGGAEDVRGYHFFSIGPEVGEQKVIPGNIKAVLRSEIFIPNQLLRLDYDQIKFSAFFDCGQLWRTIQTPSTTYLPAKGLRASTGLCLRWVSAFLPPLTLSLNYPLPHHADEKFKYDYFSVSTNIGF